MHRIQTVLLGTLHAVIRRTSSTAQLMDGPLTASSCQTYVSVPGCVLQNQIKKIRDRPTQLDVVGVPEQYLDGHAFHTYTLTSDDQSVQFVFKHNVVDRTIYAEGTVDAVLFLAKKVQEKAEQRVYSMIDVLKEGSLR